MKTTYVASSILWIGIIGSVSFFSCTRTTSTRNTTSDAASTNGADSVSYMLTVDSVSIPIKLQEMGDFPVYSKNTPYRFDHRGTTGNYKDTKYLHFLNGQMIEGRERDRILRKLKVEDIESIEFLPAEKAMEDYGQKAAHGIFYIETKDKK